MYREDWLLLLFICGPGFVLGLVSSFRKRSWKHLLVALPCSTVGLALPLWLLLWAPIFAPRAKDECPLGWLNCTHIARWALIPVMIWAHVAFHQVQVARTDLPRANWVRLGLANGAFLYGVWFILDAFFFHHGPVEGVGEFLFLLAPPLSLCAWYTVLLIRESRDDARARQTWKPALLRACPFWVAAWLGSLWRYNSLPETYECFVVTAAQRGHEPLVGPFAYTVRGGVRRRANQQLLTFWEFERRWELRLPRSHRMFRAFYNRIGPGIARLIHTRHAADGMYLLLKPAEWSVRLIMGDQGHPQ